MALTVEPLQLSDVDDYLEVQRAAFMPAEADMIYAMQFPDDPQRPDQRDHLRAKLLATTKDRLHLDCFCVRDTATGRMAGVSLWTAPRTAAADAATADAEWAQAQAARAALPPVASANPALSEAFFRISCYEPAAVIPGVRHRELRVLAIHPAYQRRGVGSLLLAHGLAVGDTEGVPTYVSASRGGRPLYERFGFEVLRDFPFDARDYGGRSQGAHWSMFRPVGGAKS